MQTLLSSTSATKEDEFEERVDPLCVIPSISIDDDNRSEVDQETSEVSPNPKGFRSASLTPNLLKIPEINRKETI